jgi:hypothetical protein
MNRLPARVLALTAIVSAGCVRRAGEAPRDARTGNTSGPIPLAQVRERGIMGRLGVPMGTIVEVTGEVVENRSFAKGEATEPFFLRVDTVDGTKLEHPQLYPSSAMPLARKAGLLSVGDPFRCVGYEVGYYHGSPPGEFKYIPSRADFGFGFASKFIVLAVK